MRLVLLETISEVIEYELRVQPPGTLLCHRQTQIFDTDNLVQMKPHCPSLVFHNEKQIEISERSVT